MTAIRLGTILLLATLAAAQQSPLTKTGDPSPSEPKLPVFDDKACPLSNRVDGKPDPITTKIKKSEPMYSSWEEKRVVVDTLKVGEEVTVWSGVNVIREPDHARTLQPGLPDDPPALQPGDEVLGYGLRGNGDYVFWAKGVWSSRYYESVIAKGGGCGFADKTQCDIEITANGVNESWVQVKTAHGLTGWVMASKNVHDKTWSDANFGELCLMD